MLRRKICTFCLKMARINFDIAKNLNTHNKNEMRFIHIAFWWLRRTVCFAGKEELAILRKYWLED